MLITELEKILNEKGEEKTKLLQPAVKKAAELGLIPAHSSLEDYEKNWGAIEEVLSPSLRRQENESIEPLKRL